MKLVQEKLGVSEREACRAIGQPRSTQRHDLKVPDDEQRVVAEMVALATQYGRYGCRRISALLRRAGWRVTEIDSGWFRWARRY